MRHRIAFLAPPLLLLATACQADLKCGPLEVDHVRRLCVCPNGGEHREGLCYRDGSVTPLDGMILGDAGAMPDDAQVAMEDAGAIEDAGAMEDAGVAIEDASVMEDAHVEPFDAGTDACALATYYRDADGDGFGDPASPMIACERPDGYVEDDTDCDDGCASCNPAGTELCDGRNNDCDAAIDEGVLTTFYRDADGDGFGTSAMAMQGCVAPAGFVTQSGDCDDSCAACFPGNTEVCDGLDNDCVGGVDDGVRTTYYADCDGDGYAVAGGVSTMACEEPSGGPVSCSSGGWTTREPTSGQADCLDTNPSVRPGQTSFFSEPISGVPLSRRWDYDCDGTTTFEVTRVDVLACGGGSSGCSARSGWAGSSIPVCGATAEYVLCASLTPGQCNSINNPRARQQACR